MSDDLEFIVIDDIPEYIFCIGDDEENERVIALSGKDGAFKYEKVAELPTTGEDGVLYLVPKSHTTQTASGNPINVNITDNAGKIESLELDGDTYQQNYTGKNLFDIEQYINAILRTQGDAVSLTKTNSTTLRATNKIKQGFNFCGIPIPNYTELLGKECTASGKATLSGVALTRVTFAWNNSGVSVFGTPLDISQSGTFSYTATIPSTAPSGATGLMLVVYANGNNNTGDVGSYVDWSELQLEESSTATSYEPYVGGQPSPSPSYPQQVQTVTGEQTVTINSTNYPISLGSIELCKLGDYQDYIWKDGEDWKVHKECNSGTSNIQINGIAINISTPSTASRVGAFCSLRIDNPNIDYNNTLGRALASENIGTYKLDTSVTGDAAAESMQDGTFCQRQGTNDRIYFKNSAYAGKTGEQIRAIIAATQLGGTNYWYPLATATDTAITDSALIAQLEAIRTASLESGSNTISNTATGTNLAGDLEIGYYGYDPLNKYDKYFWLDIDGGYESL